MLDALQKLWEQQPDMRLGQLVWTLQNLEKGSDMFQQEDDLTMQKMLMVLNEKGIDSKQYPKWDLWVDRELSKLVNGS